MVARVVIGELPGGGFGLKSSLPGIDVLSVTDDDTQKLSFSSNWTNVAQVHLTGVAELSLFNLAGRRFQNILWNPLGYIPFIEVRGRVDNVLFDDFNIKLPPQGEEGQPGFATSLVVFPSDGRAEVSNLSGNTFRFVFFVVYRIKAF